MQHDRGQQNKQNKWSQFKCDISAHSKNIMGIKETVTVRRQYNKE